MVRNLVWLKARLTWNGIRTDKQRRFGFPVAVVLLSLAGWFLATSLVDTAATLPSQALPHFMTWSALLFFVVWVSLPVIIFPLDENLDPQQLSILPISIREIIAGLATASLVAPAIVVPALVLTANAIALPSGWWMVIPASLLFIAMLAVGAQLFSAAISAILRTRRGRDVATFLILGMAAGGFFAYRSIDSLLAVDSLEEVVTRHALEGPWSLLPPVAAQRAMTDAASNEPISAVGYLVIAVLGLAVMALIWERLMGWMLTTPQEGSRPAARARRGGFTTGPWGVVTTLARKELRFYVRDPRQRLVWTGTVIFVGLAVAGTVMGTTGLFDVSERPWAPLAAPILVLFVGLPIALNLFGWERNAASFLFVLPVKPRNLLLGKNLAVAIALVVETALLAVGLALFTGFWGWVWLVPALTVAAVGCQLAVGNVVSVLAPLRLPREGTDVFAQSTEQGCLAIVSQLVSFLTIGLLLVIPASVVVLTVSFGQVIDPWQAAVACVAWGTFVYGLSLWISSVLLRRRLPEVMAWVQVV